MILVSDLLKIRGFLYCGTKLKKQTFKYVCIDSRKANAAEIFFAIKGEKHDAHAYLKDVFDKGCNLAVVNESWFKNNKQKFLNQNFFVVKDTTLALGELAKEHKRRLKIKTLAVGGSNGKTTTKEMLAAVLSKKFNVLFTAGNFNNHIGVPLTLLRLNEKHNFCVLEFGCNHFKEIKYLCEIAEPDYGLITNIGKEHLEFFKTKSGVAKAEFEMLDYFEKSKKPKVFFANLEDEFIRRKIKKLNNTRVVSYGYNFKADIQGVFKGYNKKFNPVIEISGKGFKNETFKINAFGKHSIYNGLAAATVAKTFKVDTLKIKSALKNFKSDVGKRMEVINLPDLILINDTYNSNPDSVLLGLNTIAELKTQARKHIVLGDMLELGNSSVVEHANIGLEVKKLNYHYLYTYGAESKQTFFAAKGILFNKHYIQKEKLLEDLKKNLCSNDVVYVKGSRGMKMEEIVEALKFNK